MAPLAASARSSWVGRGGVVDRQVAQDPGLRLGVLEDRAAAAARRAAARPARAGRAGPSRPRRTARRPASEATATSRSRVTAKAAGRRPLRSTSAPTRRPSAKTIAAGPSHGARNPAVRRRSVATCGCGARRSAERLGDRRQQRRRQVPAGRRQELEAPRRATASRSRPARGAGRPRAARRAIWRRAAVARRGRGPARGCRGPC